MGTMITPQYTYLTGLLEDMLRMTPLTGSTAKQTEINKSNYEGKIVGLNLSLSCFGNHLRVQKVQPLMERMDSEERNRARWIPALNQFDFSGWSDTVRKRWDSGQWGGKSDLEFMTEMHAEFDALVFDEDFNRYYTGLRKDLVKAGRLDPDESDRAWIEEEYQAHKSMFDPLQALVSKLGPPS